MTRFLTSLAFCSFLLLVGAFLMATSLTAKEDVISTLLSMPAPPPPNPLVRSTGMSPERLTDKKNPPGDDAPIEDLMEYWQAQSSGYRELGYNIMPSPRSLDRIRAEIEKDPRSIASYMNIMRDSRDGAEFVKRIYDNLPRDNDEDGGRSSVKRWLTMNSSYFSGQLTKTANRAGDRNEYVSNQEEVLALAKYDWDAVRPTVDRLYGDSGQPVSRVLAMWGLYRHALTEDSIGDTDRYRDELKAVVEDKKATAGMRDLAFDALVKEKDWSGRDEWYYSLLEDETLGDLRVNGSSYTGLTTIVMYSPPDKYADKMIELVKSNNLAVRSAAAKNLVVILDAKRPDVVRALLPWLEDPKWAKDAGGSRQQLVNVLQSLKIPESVPGLIAVLDEKEMQSFPVRDLPSGAMSNMNAMASNRAIWSGNIAANGANAASNSMRTVNIANYPLRNQAITALGMQGDMRAVPVLRRLLNQAEGYDRGTLVKSILLCKGFTVAEQADALETLAKAGSEIQVGTAAAVSNAIMTMSNTMAVTTNSPDGWGDPDIPRRWNTVAWRANGEDLKFILATELLRIEEPGDPLVREVVVRIKLLEKSDPPVAATLRSILMNWKGAAINALFLQDLKDGKANATEVVKLLTVRKELREKQSGEVFDIRTGNPIAAGIAACLLENESDYTAVLGRDNNEAKAATFACARLIRAKLPVQEAAKYLSSSDKRLAVAAELYLESEDSPEARSIVLSLHPNEAKILGATTAFFVEGVSVASSPQLFGLFASVNGGLGNGSNWGTDLKDKEKRLQAELKQDGELLGVYSYTDNFIRIYKDRVMYSWEEDQSRYRERALNKEEFENLTGYFTHHNVDELTPFLACNGECEPAELLMLGKQGGRRVFVNSTHVPRFFAELDSIFKDMRVAPAKLRYTLEKDVPGLEILFADDDKSAKTVWKNGDDLRLLIVDNVKRKEIDREIETVGETFEDAESDVEEPNNSVEEKVFELKKKHEFDNFAWFKLESGRLTGTVSQPDQVEFLPLRDSFAVEASSGQWKAKAAGVEIRGNPQGLHKITGGKIAKIQNGNYDSPVITANGRWAIATKYSEDDGPTLVRVNLATNKETPVLADKYPAYRAIAFVPSVNRVLTTSVGYGESEDFEEEEPDTTSGRDYYWLDADTGVLTKAIGEVRPLGQQKFRSLQPTANAFEFWAAIYDRNKNITNVGVYNSKTFTFKQMIAIPTIEFESMDMWVDSAAGKIYFVYSGHLLALPLPKK